MKEETKRAAVEVMTEWAKSAETEPTQELTEVLERYFEECSVNNDKYNGEPIGLREIYFGDLVIKCINSCSSAELAKLDSIKEKVSTYRG